MRKNLLLFLLSFSAYILSLAYITRIFYIYHYSPQNLFFLGLIGVDFTLPVWIIYLASVGSFLLFCLLSTKLFSYPYSYLSMLIFAISPWTHYLTVAGSAYIFLLFTTLLAAYGVILMGENYKNLGMALFLIGGAISMYSFVSAVFLYAILFIYLLKYNLIRRILSVFTLGIMLTIILGFFSLQHQGALNNIVNNEITIFANPGLLGESNRLQGDSRKSGYVFFTRLVENKYLYLTKYTLLKLLSNFAPTVFFTPQEKLLNFSYSPPIFLGFLIPFLYGLYHLLKKAKQFLLILPILVIPSLLSEKMVDLNRLVIAFPVIVLIITFGIKKLLDNKNLKTKIFTGFIAAAVLLQLLFTLSDISLREDIRYHRYFGINLLDNLGRQ